jgi:hypothetical protein
MTTADRFTILIAAIGLLWTVIAALIVLLWRIAVKMTRTEDAIAGLGADITDLVKDKDKVHLEITREMREDRAATDRRLRWLEEHIWNRGSKV